MAKMTKADIIRELEMHGDFHLDMFNWPKAKLADYLDRCKQARACTIEELVARLKAHGKM